MNFEVKIQTSILPKFEFNSFEIYYIFVSLKIQILDNFPKNGKSAPKKHEFDGEF